MKEHIEDILVGGRPMTDLELKDKEIERLNNIINELEKWLESYNYIGDYQEVLDKLKELKENKL